jgi:hypothetical protein
MSVTAQQLPSDTEPSNDENRRRETRHEARTPTCRHPELCQRLPRRPQGGGRRVHRVAPHVPTETAAARAGWVSLIRITQSSRVICRQVAVSRHCWRVASPATGGELLTINEAMCASPAGQATGRAPRRPLSTVAAGRLMPPVKQAHNYVIRAIVGAVVGAAVELGLVDREHLPNDPNRQLAGVALPVQHGD